MRRGSRADAGWGRIRTCRLSISHRGLFDKGRGCSGMEAAGGERTILPLGGGGPCEAWWRGTRDVSYPICVARLRPWPPPTLRVVPPPVPGGISRHTEETPSHTHTLM